MDQPKVDLQRLLEGFHGSPFWRYLGIEIEQLEAGRALIRLPMKPEFQNVNDGIHGGVIASLMDSAMGVTLRSLTSDAHVTESLTTQFLRAPSANGTLYATATVVRQGRKVVAMHGEVYDERDRLIAVAMATFMNVANG